MPEPLSTLDRDPFRGLAEGAANDLAAVRWIVWHRLDLSHETLAVLRLDRLAHARGLKSFDVIEVFPALTSIISMNLGTLGAIIAGSSPGIQTEGCGTRRFLSDSSGAAAKSGCDRRVRVGFDAVGAGGLVGFGLLRGFLVNHFGALVYYLDALVSRGFRLRFLFALAVVGRVEPRR